jgi:hypothetical protein
LTAVSLSRKASVDEAVAVVAFTAATTEEAINMAQLKTNNPEVVDLEAASTIEDATGSMLNQHLTSLKDLMRLSVVRTLHGYCKGHTVAIQLKVTMHQYHPILDSKGLTSRKRTQWRRWSI